MDMYLLIRKEIKLPLIFLKTFFLAKVKCIFGSLKYTWMEILIKAGQLILSLSILIVLHEFGHYLPARWFKTRVEKFYLFFDYKFSLFKKKIGDTEWGLGWLPLGGYVKISGMIDESMDTEQLKQEPQPWEFSSKPAWQRLIIMLGGIIVNLILGFGIYIFILWGYGKSFVRAEGNGHGIQVGEVLQKYGFQNSDRVLTMGGKEIKSLDELGKGIMLRGERDFVVLHANGEEQSISLPEDVEYEIFATDGMSTVSHRYYPVIGQVVDGLEAHKKGLKAGDAVFAINGNEIKFWDEFTESIKSNAGGTLALTIERAGKIEEIS